LFGNSWARWRELTVGVVDQLERVDGKEVLPSERIKGKQAFDELLEELELEIAKKEEKDKQKTPEEKEKEYNRESRRQMYLDLAKQKEEDERKKNPDKYKEKPKETPMHKADGEMRQVNEGHYKFALDDSTDAEYSVFTLSLPKFLDISLIEVNLFPFFVSVRVKGKLTQVRMWEEIIVEKSEVKRSSTTGELVIKMKKVTPNYGLAAVIQREEEQKKQEELKRMKEKEEKNIKETNPYGNQKYEDKRKNKDILQIGKKADLEPGFEDLPDLE
jgi:protein TilB